MKKIVTLFALLFAWNASSNAQSGEALHFDGGNDYANLGATSALALTGDITFETWIKPDVGASGTFFFNGGGFGLPGYAFHLFGSTLRVELNDGTIGVQANNTVSILGAWHHVAFTRSESTGLVLVYLDGSALPGTATLAGPLGLYFGGALIGAYTGGSGAYFKGSMDETRVWDRVLCSEEIQQSMNCEIPTDAPGLVANYHYNQGVAGAANGGVSILLDATSNAVNGSLSTLTLNGPTSNWIAPGAVVTGTNCGTFTIPVLTTLATPAAICTGGSSVLTVSGGSTYSWTPGSMTGSSVTVNPAVTTTYTVTEISGGTCILPVTLTLSVSAAVPSITSASQTNVTCNGLSNGSVSVNAATGGTGSYTYDWTPGTPVGDGTLSISALSAASYTCIATDANGCTAAQIFTVTEPAALTDYGITAAVSDFCVSGSTTITTSGSTSGINYTLKDGSTIVAGPITGTGSPLVFNTGTITGTTTYNVFAETVNSAKALHFNGGYVDPNVFSTPSDNFTIECWINPSTTHQIDAQSTGSTTGTAGQAYVLWPTLHNSGCGVGISAGTNGVSVYEHSGGYMPPLLVWPGTVTGWTHIAVVYTSRQPSLYVNGALVATGLSSTRSACYASLGAAGVDYSNTGGIGGGSYGSFVGGIDEFRIWNYSLPAGQIAANMNSCMTGAEAGLFACYHFDETSGSVANDVSPGLHNGNLVNVLPADRITGAVCGGPICSNQMVQTATIAIHPNPTASATSASILCNAGTAAVTVTAMGGTTPYTGDGIFTESAGTYTYVVTDSNGCTGTTSPVTLTEPSAISTNITLTNVSCNGGNEGAIDLTISGGVGPYTVDWNSGAYTTEDLTNLTAGSYSGVLTDANGCTDGGTVVITEPSAVTATIALSGGPTTCSGADGFLNISVSGGTPGYTYLWSTLETSQNISSLAAGNYTLEVTDSVMCVSNFSYTLLNPAPPTVTLAVATDTVCQSSSLPFSLSGGMPAGGIYSGTAVASGVFTPGSAAMGFNMITYTYMDSNGCSASSTDSIFVDICTGISSDAQAGSVYIYPNPTSGMLYVESGVTDKQITVVDVLGNEVYNVQSFVSKTEIDMNKLANGIYFVKVAGKDSLTIIKVLRSK